jgi:biotin carboxyl carrier protein
VVIDKKRTAIRASAFVALVGVEILLAHSMRATPSIRGYVDTRSFSISSPQKALVRKIDVSLGEHVTAGQLIAELDGSSIESEMSVAMAERKQLIAAGRTATLDEDALRTVDTRLEELAEKRDGLRLKAPSDGMIESIEAHPGDVVTADTPVANVVTADTRHVIACVPEQRIGEVDIGTVAVVHASVGNHQAQGTVESLTPAVAELPARCQPTVAKPRLFGRLAVITLDHAEALMPGESEMISFGARKSTIAPHTAAIEPAAPGLIDVPPEIVAVSRVEASGLVWVPSLQRYVVVSDETDDRHSPWLFTMSRRGVIDPEPMVIENISELDDIESIAAGDNGALWVMASQSVSERGKRPRARQVLARLVPEGAGYKVDQKVHLFELLTPEVARELGVDKLDDLDIEGLAWHGGALYIGLKSPRAVIWKVDAPDKLLAGDVTSIHPWGTPTMTVNVDGRPVPAGISDMTFVGDHALLVTATASNMNAKRQDGALFYVTEAGGKLTALQMQTFSDLRPEGVTMSPDAGHAVIVFDRGKEAPLWTTIDLPTSGL